MEKIKKRETGIGETAIPVEVNPITPGAIIHNPKTTGLVPRSLGIHREAVV
jgi:hypothetical protein